MKKMEITTAKRIDNALFLVLKITGVLVAALVTASFFANVNPLWMAVVLSLSLLSFTVLMVLKGALTGKRYAQGAKNRRAKWLPMLFNDDESLEDDVINTWKN